MLFRYTENPPENTIFPPAALRVSAVASAYTENSSFPYRAFPDCVLKGFVERAARLYEQEREEREGSSALGKYVRRWNGWVKGGLGGHVALSLLQPSSPPIDA